MLKYTYPVPGIYGGNLETCCLGSVEDGTVSQLRVQVTTVTWLHLSLVRLLQGLTLPL